MTSLIIQDRLDLERRFYRNYDASLVHSMIQMAMLRPQTLQKLGEGCHFQAWTLKGRQSSLVVSISKHEDQVQGFEARSWLRTMLALKKIETDHCLLTPPFTTFEHEGRAIFVTPFGDNIMHQLKPIWGERKNLEKQYRADLARQNLMIDDCLQMRSHEGVPFVIDFSSLKSI